MFSSLNNSFRPGCIWCRSNFTPCRKGSSSTQWLTSNCLSFRGRQTSCLKWALPKSERKKSSQPRVICIKVTPDNLKLSSHCVWAFQPQPNPNKIPTGSFLIRSVRLVPLLHAKRNLLRQGGKISNTQNLKGAGGRWPLQAQAVRVCGKCWWAGLALFSVEERFHRDLWVIDLHTSQARPPVSVLE